MDKIKETVLEAVKIIDEKKGENIKLLNLNGISPIADYFVLASGNNQNQLHAICDEISEKLSKKGLFHKQIEGYQTGNWILMDYGDFMIHLFLSEARDFYNLDRIWKDAIVEEI